MNIAAGVETAVKSAKTVEKCTPKTGTVLAFACWGGGICLLFVGTGIWIATHS